MAVQTGACEVQDLLSRRFWDLLPHVQAAPWHPACLKGTGWGSRRNPGLQGTITHVTACRDAAVNTLPLVENLLSPEDRRETSHCGEHRRAGDVAAEPMAASWQGAAAQQGRTALFGVWVH